MKREKNRRKTGKYLKCKECGKERYVPKCRVHSFKFCSVGCRNDSMRVPLDVDMVRELYESGKSTIEIGDLLGLSGAGVGKILKRNGVMLRSRTAHLVTDKNPTKGKGHTEETKQKLREIAKKQFSSKEARDLASSKQTQFLSRKYKNGDGRTVSSVEDMVADELSRRDVPYERQVKVRDTESGMFVACVDFMVNGVAIEVNGTYWHADPREYPDGPVFMSQKRTFERYEKKVKALARLGIPLIEVWEMDVKRDVSLAVTLALG